MLEPRLRELRPRRGVAVLYLAALTACTGKLLVILDTVLKTNTPWNPELAPENTRQTLDSRHSRCRGCGVAPPTHG